MGITNELLAHMSYSAVENKNLVREQLEKDLAEFLEKGGVIQPLEMGFTNFEDGIVPVARKQPMSEQERKAKDEAIAKRNLEIKQYKEALKAEKRNKAKQALDARLKEQIEIMTPYFKQLKNKEDFKQFAEKIGYRTNHIRNGSRGHVRFSDEKWALMKQEVSKILGAKS